MWVNILELPPAEYLPAHLRYKETVTSAHYRDRSQTLRQAGARKTMELGEEAGVGKHRHWWEPMTELGWMGRRYSTLGSVRDIWESSDDFRTGQQSDFYESLLI